MAKKEVMPQQPQPQVALKRVYMDINSELHHQAKVIALTQGLDLKSLLEKLITDCVADFQAKEADSKKRAGKK